MPLTFVVFENNSSQRRPPPQPTSIRDLFFSTLNRNLISYLISIVGAEYIFNILPRGTHDYKNFIKPSEFCKILRKNSLEVHSIKGINYNFLNNKFYESSNPIINYIIHCKKNND